MLHWCVPFLQLQFQKGYVHMCITHISTYSTTEQLLQSMRNASLPSSVKLTFDGIQEQPKMCDAKYINDTLTQ